MPNPTRGRRRTLFREKIRVMDDLRRRHPRWYAALARQQRHHRLVNYITLRRLREWYGTENEEQSCPPK